MAQLQENVKQKKTKKDHYVSTSSHCERKKPKYPKSERWCLFSESATFMVTISHLYTNVTSVKQSLAVMLAVYELLQPATGGGHIGHI